MSLLTVNDANVIAGTIEAPLRGVWTADLVIDQPDGSGFSAGTSVTIKAQDGIELVGTVAPDRSGDFLDAVHVRVLGGAGGMGANITAKGYTTPGAFVRDVLNGIAQDAGETLSSDILQSLLTTNLEAWNTLAIPASQNLVALLNIVAPNADWRILADLAAGERGIREAIAKMVRQEIAGIDYFTLYDAKVVSQSTDGATVDLQPGDPRLPGMSKVPLRLGLPGTVAKFAPGQFVRLGWDRGNPSLPYACLFQGGETVSRISVAGDTDAARKGDHSDAGTWVFAFTPGPAAVLSITYTDPDGVVTTLAGGTGTVIAKGKLTEGSTKVGLG